MEFYKKPVIADKNFLNGLFPAIVGPVVGFLKWGVPVVIAAATLKKDNRIDSTHTNALTARKDFSLV